MMHPGPIRYSLRTLLIVSIFAPAVLAAGYFTLVDWRWLDLWLLLPLAAATAAGICAIVRWKWYGLIPAVTLALLAGVAAPFERLYLLDLVEPIRSGSPRERVLTWLLASAATLIALASIWAGYSRVRWFWRAAAIGACFVLLATMDVREPILFCLATMPAIAVGSWLIRFFQDRSEPPAVIGDEQKHPKARSRWLLRDALMFFVASGLFAIGLWPLMSGDFHFSSDDFAISSISYIATCLATAAAGLARYRMSRVLLSLVALMHFVIGLAVHRLFTCDPLGLLYYFGSSNQLHLVAMHGLAVAAMMALLLLLTRLYAMAGKSSRSLYRRLAGGMLAMIVLVLALPLAIVYPRMLPPATNASALPPSITYNRLLAVERHCHWLREPDFNASLVVKEAKEVLAEPGNVWYQPGEFRDSELQYHVSRDSIGYLPSLLEIETAQAEQAGRPSECLELAILQWRLGRVLRHGGVFTDWEQGYRSESYGCGAVSDAVDKLSLEECRLALAEVRLSLADRPDTETVLAYHAYWGRVCFGWRQAFLDSSRWLAGEKMDAISSRVNKPQFAIMNKLGLTRLRLVETRLALELYRRKHGQWPAELRELVPEYLKEVPADPFAASSLIYRRKDAGFLLYSVGPDGKDDGCRTSNNESDIKRGWYDMDWELDRRIQLQTWPRKPPS